MNLESTRGRVEDNVEDAGCSMKFFVRFSDLKGFIAVLDGLLRREAIAFRDVGSFDDLCGYESREIGAARHDGTGRH